MNTIIDRTDGTCMQLQCGNHCPLNCIFDRIFEIFKYILSVFSKCDCSSNDCFIGLYACYYKATTMHIYTRNFYFLKAIYSWSIFS